MWLVTRLDGIDNKRPDLGDKKNGAKEQRECKHWDVLVIPALGGFTGWTNQSLIPASLSSPAVSQVPSVVSSPSSLSMLYCCFFRLHFSVGPGRTLFFEFLENFLITNAVKMPLAMLSAQESKWCPLLSMHGSRAWRWVFCKQPVASTLWH